LPDQAVEQLLARAPGALTAPEVASLAPAIREVFATFAFDTALRLALAVLDAGMPISSADRSTLCGVAALTAHNRQFFSRGNERIARFLLDTYREALVNESDPNCRLGLYYRLAVTHCRRLGDTASARCVIDAGLAELAQAELPILDLQLQEAWLRNIDALVRVRSGDLAAACECCEHAFLALADVVAPDRVSSAEVELSKLVISENALTLASMTGNEPLRDRWLKRARDGFESWPSLTVVDILEQQRTRIDRLEIGEACALGVTALDLARAKLNPLLEYFVLVGLSDLSFRLADLDAAADYSDCARVLGAEVGYINQTRLALELRAADIAIARGRLSEAERALRDLIVEGAPSVELRVEIWGRLAGLHARRGEGEPALALIAQLIDVTADSGELDLLLRASCHAGDVAVFLGMADDAQAAYDNCFELLGGAGTSTPSREILRLKAVVGQQRTGLLEASQARTCLQRLPRLLAQEMEAWPLARELVSWSIFDEMIPPEHEQALHTVLKALAERNRGAVIRGGRIAITQGG
jgi:tetratricopeptide (TPR) repeat protein